MANFNRQNDPNPCDDNSGTEENLPPVTPDEGGEAVDRTVQSDEFEEEGATPEDSRTFISDEFDAPAADSQTFVSDEFEEPVGAELRTVQSDEFDEPAGADLRTIQSDEFEEPAGAESKTMISDEFDEPSGDDLRTIQSDEFEEPSGADLRTIQSDEFDQPDDGLRTIVSEGNDAPADMLRTMMSEDYTGGDDDESFDAGGDGRTIVTDAGGPRFPDAGGRTIVTDSGSASDDDSMTMQSDDGGLMAQSNIRQTINPKSMDSRDRSMWNSVIRGALGSQAVASRRKDSGKSSLVTGGGSNLIIQTRTLIDGPPTPGISMDYRIEKKLGEGGMGAVYLANQTSLNRNVALKVIKPISDKESVRLQRSGRLDTIRQHREGQFLSEAVVTGDLEHPNIVPIYDVAATQDGTVFYAMKCVVGTPWSKAVRKKKLHENLDILMKVCDAMAFAHSRGIVHRDLKPENVMLGEFGVVLVMDWGLALTTPQFSKQSSVRKTTSLGGSPAYMSPELATGPLDRIGAAADIYLIGAMLYEILTGRPPHSGSNVSQCLKAAASNKVDPAKEEGELLDIAHKAMATKPEDRYATVQEFQEAVRGYLSHAESIGIAHRARLDLHSARDSQTYADFARAMYGFESALDMWDGNEPARIGLSQAQLEYAELALSKADYELGLSLLSDENPAHLPIVNRLREAQKEQESRKHRLAWMKRVAAALLAIIFIGGSGGLYVIAQEKEAAEEARDEAVVAKQEAEVARDDAVKAEQAAEEARDEALLAKAEETKAKERAIGLQQEAERAAVAEKAAKEEALVAQRKAEEARQLAVAEQQKAERAAAAEKLAKEQAVAAAEAEKKAKDAAVLAEAKAVQAAADEKKAKDEALLAKAQEEKARIAAQMAAEQERKAKEAENQARLLAEAERRKAEEQRQRAEMAAEAEKKAKQLEEKARIAAQMAAEQERIAQIAATKAKDAAIVAQKAEEQAKIEAIAAKDAETKAKQEALYESYVAKIGLAKARIDQNEFEGARELLEQLKRDPNTSRLCGWEWSRLMHQAGQATSDVSAEEPARDVSFSTSGRRAVAAVEGRQVRVLDVGADGRIVEGSSRRITLDSEAGSADIADQPALIAAGGEDGMIRLFDSTTGIETARLEGHRGAVTKVRFLPDGRLISSSLDKTVRLWDTLAAKELAAAWHIAPVQDVAFSAGSQPVVAAAVADSRSGRAVVWQLRQSGNTTDFAAVGDFVGHGAPVLSVTVSEDGRRVASGDGTGHVYVWNRDDVTPLDYGSAIDSAISRLSKRPTHNDTNNNSAVAFVNLEDDASQWGAYHLVDGRHQTAHSEAVRSLTFSPDGQRLLSAADDFTLKVWNIGGQKLVETLRGHGGWVRSAEFAPFDDDVILSAGFDKSVKSWRLSAYSETAVLDTGANDGNGSADDATKGSPQVQAHDDEIWAAHFNRTGSQIVTTSRDQSAKVWNVRANGGKLGFEGPVILSDSQGPQAPRGLTEGHRYLAMSIHATPDGRTLLIGGVDGTLRLFNVERGTETGLLRGTGLNTGFALSNDGRLLLSASSSPNASAQLWELPESGAVPTKPRFELAGHQFPVTSFAISQDGSRLFTGDQRGTGFLWNADTGERIGEALTHHNGLRINEAAFLPDGRLLTASDDASVAIYNPEKRDVESTLRHQGFVTALELSPDSRLLLTVSERTDRESGGTVNTLQLWNLATGQSAPVMTSTDDGPKTLIRSARFSEDGKRIITLHGGYDAPESFLRLWSVAENEAPKIQRTLRLPSRLRPADTALILPKHNDAVVTLHGNSAFQWSLTNLEHRKSYRSHAAVTDAGFSADGKYVATSSESVKLWDPATGKPLFKLESPHNGAVLSVEFTPAAGPYLFVTSGTDGAARVWEWNPAAAEAKPVQALSTADASAKHAIHQATFSPDGTHVLTVGDGGYARLWKLGQAEPVATLNDPDSTADYLCAAFSPDGRAIIVGGSDKLARMWKIDAASLAAESNPPTVRLTGHADRIDSVSFLPSEAPFADAPAPLRVLTGSRDRSARLWDAETGREIMSLRMHGLGLTAVDAVRHRENANDQAGAVLVMTAGLDGRVILWPAGP